MQKWDYKVISASPQVRTEMDELRELGEKGWELVSISDYSGFYYAWLKRPKKEHI